MLMGIFETKRGSSCKYALRHAFLRVDVHAWLQMRHCPNGTLRTFVEQTEQLSPIERLNKRLQLFQSLLQTLAWLHAAGLSHRDLKPSNVLIDGDGMPVVADFEISRDDAHVASFETTTVGRAAGTPPWMAPEVFGRRSKGDMRADLWPSSLF